MREALNANLSVRKKRLHFRAWQRGTREMDLVLGRFVDAQLHLLTDDEVEALEHLMEAPDPEIYLWVAGGADVPMEFDTPIFRKMVAFHKNGPK